MSSYHSELIVKVAESADKIAFAELFDHYAPRLKGFLMQKGAEAALAEEIVQDVMTTLWRKAHLFDPRKASASTWLYRIARNRRIDLLRRDRSDEIDGEDPALQPEAPADVSSEMDARLREERVREALRSLPPEQEEVIRLAFFTDLSHSEIADRIGLPLGTVKSRIRLAFNRLRATLEADRAVDVD
ncbi:sigma-70 family RNA polymerase sigma factor [Roseibium aestuarii]|uniref:Sigma-70 family RNA polymerase sigma factor n=1 Tax=Roseibium aestuarii TaxID=2600299 RepID=A0ABW4JUY5_9HYPH|nr:sigma-70 family RNA polymerase sigma factor [Roseibium aestuarii]